MIGIETARSSGLDIAQVFVGPGVVVFKLRKVAERLGIRFRLIFEQPLELLFFVPNLLLEQRGKHRHRGAGIFQTPERIQIAREAAKPKPPVDFSAAAPDSGSISRRSW